MTRNAVARCLALASLVVAAGCAVQDRPYDYPEDTGVEKPEDVPPADTGSIIPSLDVPPLDVVRDTGSDTRMDAGADAAPQDTGAPDGDAPDAEAPDAGTSETGVSETGVSETGVSDTGLPPLDVTPVTCRFDFDCAGSPRTPRCNTALGLCVECLPSPDNCAAGTFCDPFVYRCAPGCRADSDCALDGGVGYCDTATHACAACRTDTHCPPGSVCLSGVCRSGCSLSRPCPSGQACCSGMCFDVQSDPMRCGSCTTTCVAPRSTGTCALGRCTLACEAGFGNCNAVPSDGCETELATNLSHCGMCNRRCSLPRATAACADGDCVIASCLAGYQDCDRDPANGCEAETARDARHCGACRRACADTQECFNADCVPRVTRYTIAPSTAAWVDACAAPGRVVLLANQSYTATATRVAVPFPFRFFGVTYDQVMVAVSGFVAFGAAPTVPSYEPYSYPTTSAARPAAFPYARRLTTRATGVCVATLGAAPNRRFVIQWADASHYLDSSTNLTFQVALNEGDDTLDYLYDTLRGSRTMGEDASIGMQNHDGTRGTTYSFRAARITAGVRLRFTPAP